MHSEGGRPSERKEMSAPDPTNVVPRELLVLREWDRDIWD